MSQDPRRIDPSAVPDEFRIAHVRRSDGWSGYISRQCPVYRKIHSAIDITTAYELGAD
jgi:hypothetical protein